MTTEQFHPTFRQEYVTNPNGVRTPINPKMCLSDESAVLLAKLLGENGFPCFIVPGPPLGRLGGGFSTSVTVPWLQFGDGPTLNAGLIADYWQHQTPDVALRYALIDVGWEVANFNEA